MLLTSFLLLQLAQGPACEIATSARMVSDIGADLGTPFPLLRWVDSATVLALTVEFHGDTSRAVFTEWSPGTDLSPRPVGAIDISGAQVIDFAPTPGGKVYLALTGDSALHVFDRRILRRERLALPRGVLRQVVADPRGGDGVWVLAQFLGDTARVGHPVHYLDAKGHLRTLSYRLSRIHNGRDPRFLRRTLSPTGGGDLWLSDLFNGLAIALDSLGMPQESLAVVIDTRAAYPSLRAERVAVGASLRQGEFLFGVYASTPTEASAFPAWQGTALFAYARDRLTPIAVGRTDLRYTTLTGSGRAAGALIGPDGWRLATETVAVRCSL